jgi:hypothetical protein
MLPRWHVLWGAVFTALLYFFVPGISYWYLGLVFFASVFIDFDHYAVSCMKSGGLSLGKSFEYHRKLDRKGAAERKRGVRKKGDFHFFHTVEFHVLVGLLGVLWLPLFYVFIGMVFHSLLDVLYLANRDYLYRRDYFFTHWLLRKVR